MGALEAIFGLMFTGAPNTSLRTRSPLADANPALKSLLTQELKVEEDNIDEDLQNVKFWPVLSIGLAYHF